MRLSSRAFVRSGHSGRFVQLVATAALAVPLAARAAPTLDQSNLTGGAGIGATFAQSYQQGLTAGGSGLLSQVDLHILYLATDPQPAGYAPTNTFFLDIFGSAPWNGSPQNSRSPLASVAVTVTQTGWLSIDVSSAGLVLSTGDQFAIGLRSGVLYGLGVDSSGPYNPYAGGSLYGNGDLIQGNQQGIGAWDMVFRTYLDSSVPGTGQPLPVPGTAGLVAAGLLAAALRRPRLGNSARDGAVR